MKIKSLKDLDLKDLVVTLPPVHTDDRRSIFEQGLTIEVEGGMVQVAGRVKVLSVDRFQSVVLGNHYHPRTGEGSTEGQWEVFVLGTDIWRVC